MRLRHKIEVWQNTSVNDGFGGNTTTEEKITESWAIVETMGVNSRYSNIASSEGVESASNGIVVTVRKRRDIVYNKVNQFIKFKGVSYQIQTNPVNIDFNNDYIVFVAVRDEISDVPELDPVT